MLELIKTRLNVIFPQAVANVVLEYCDEFDTIGKRQKINITISIGYYTWLVRLQCHRAFCETEYNCKREIWVLTTGEFAQHWAVNSLEWREYLLTFAEIEQRWGF